ncbi:MULTISPECIES: KdsC family phosphatase [unclassified Helicobacter]|uniref:KdsC family phosphatase n=1 Tax=unclassified Helicobacter TaxID=2593540 RepID=UPI000CF0FD7F|nr:MULTISPECIES: HAD hydrolase family protein [unclassified Helicobacter]
MIELLLLDMDGTLTDGKLYYLHTREEFKAFNVQDGMGITCWLELKKKIAIISGRASQSAMARTKDLGIDECFFGIKDKGEVALELMKKYKLQADQVACMGDDINDLLMFDVCGLKIAPANAVQRVKENADLILNHSGGEGAVREAIDYILQKEGLEGKVLEFFKK